MNALDVAFRETKCVNIRIDLTRDIPLTVLGKYHQLSKKDRRINLREIIYAEDFPPLADILSDIVSERQSALNAHCRVHIGDDYHWVYLSCVLRKDTFNRTQHLTGTMMDVSEYLDAADSDSVLTKAVNKNKARIYEAMNSEQASLAEILGNDYLLRIQQAFTMTNGLSSAIYDSSGELLLSAPDEQGRTLSQKRFKYKQSEEIRYNHRLLATWTIASDSQEMIAKNAPLLKILAETVSQIANAILILYNEMENSKIANQQLGSSIEHQILLNNIYTIILEMKNADEALKQVIKLVGEYMKLDRVALYDYDSESGYTALSKAWAAEGVEENYRFKTEDFPELMEELNYCDTFFSTGAFDKKGKTDIKSFVVSQLAENGKFSGLIFYETVNEERIWSSSDKKLFRNISQIISTMLIRCNMDAALRQQNEQLKMLAFTDPVLGISNRTCLDRNLKTELEKGGSGAAVSIQLSNMSTVSEAFGHIHSDVLLKKIAKYIDGMEFKGKRVYRFSGSVLMILLKNGDKEAARQFLDSLVSHFAKAWSVGGEEYYMDMVAGVAFYPADGSTCDDIYSSSTLAMYQAAEKSKNRYVFYSRECGESAGTAFTAEKSLRKAVLNNMEGFSLNYKSVTDVSEGSIVALEAVVCWNDGEHDIKPAQIIQLAESMGLDETIDAWMINNACGFLREVIDLTGRKDLIMNINLTFHELQNSGVHETIREAIERYSLKGENIAVEVPEKSQVKFYAETRQVLTCLHKIGVTIITDDFFREYMSATSLKNDLIGQIKIRADQFCNADEFDRTALNTILRLAHLRGIKVCAKHIENEEQLSALKDYPIDLLQGSYVIPALNAEMTKSLIAGTNVAEAESVDV